MSNEIIQYLVNQSSGVVISLVLIWRIESKLDSINASITALTKQLVERIKTK